MISRAKLPLRRECSIWSAGGAAQRNTAQNERACVVSELLSPVSVLLTHPADGVELFNLAFRKFES
jgi:hypothetical protein